MKFINDSVDGVNYLRITDDRYQYTYAYYSANKWVDNNRIVLSRNDNNTKKEGEFYENSVLVLVDIKNQTEEVIVDKKGINAFVVYENMLYYGYNDGFYSYNIDTKETKLLYEGGRVQLPHITNDGRYVSFRIVPKTYGDINTCVVVDTLNSTYEEVFKKNFNGTFPEANHHMICPTDKDKIFFAHEGDTFYVSNRLWLYSKENGIHALAKQRLDSEGNLGDCFGHECWAHDGKGVYFVKYPCSPMPPRGICYVDTDGNQTDVLYGKYRYWHVCAAPNGKFLASDTQDETFSRVCFINTETGEEKCVIKVNTTWQHPCHPHPSFSPDSEKLCFQELYNDKISVGIIDIKNIL